MYQTIVEHMAEGVAITVEDERVYVNPAYLRIHGLTDASEVLGKSMSLFMDADSRRAANKARDARLRGEDAPETIEYRIQRPDGEQRVLEVTPTAIIYEGQPASLALIRDVTARTCDREQLLMGGVVADNMAEGVSVAVGTTRVYVNRAFTEIHGIEDESEAIGQPIDQFIIPEDKERILDMWQARQRGAQVPDRVEYRVRRVDGVERTVETSTTTITYQGQPAVLGIIRDITDRKQAAAALQQSEELYRNVAEKMAEGLSISVDGIRVYVNKALSDIYGLDDPSQLIGKTVVHNLAPEDRQRALDRTLARQRGGFLPVTTEYRIY